MFCIAHYDFASLASLSLSLAFSRASSLRILSLTRARGPLSDLQRDTYLTHTHKTLNSDLFDF